MDLLLLILAILSLCGVNLGPWLAITAIVEVVLLTIKYFIKKE